MVRLGVWGLLGRRSLMEWCKNVNMGCARTPAHDIDFLEPKLSLELEFISLCPEPVYDK